MRLTLKELRHSSGPAFSENSFSSFLFLFLYLSSSRLISSVPLFAIHILSLPTFSSLFPSFISVSLPLSPFLHTLDPNMPFQNYMLSVRVIGVTYELVSFCEG
jgi:hypothetical protein